VLLCTPRCIGETTRVEVVLEDETFALGPGDALTFGAAVPRSAACGMTFTGYDLVEVAPAYDTNAQTTALLAADIAYEFLTLTALCRA
jgi:hypothetical protein